MRLPVRHAVAAALLSVALAWAVPPSGATPVPHAYATLTSPLDKAVYHTGGSEIQYASVSFASTDHYVSITGGRLGNG